MKRTTVSLTDELKRMLQDVACRTQRPQAEIIREALMEYLTARGRPWPRSIGMGRSADRLATSENVKKWVRERWRRELEGDQGESPYSTPRTPPACDA